MDLRTKILQANDIEAKLMTIPEWDVEIKIKAMSGKERADFLKKTMDSKGNMDLEKANPMILIATCFNPKDDSKIFTFTDINEINKKSSNVIERIAKKALELSGLGEGAREEAKND